MVNQRRTLVRDVLHATPDGNTVRRTEKIVVDVVWPDDHPPPELTQGYVTHGEWRLTSKSEN